MDSSTAAAAGKHYYDAPDPIMVEMDSVYRCQHSGINQCQYHTLEGQAYCKYHIGVYNANFRKAARLKKYKLTQHYMRVDEFVCNPELKNLSEEIGILSMTLESLLNQCHTPFDLQINQSRIESLIEKIAKTTQVNARLQSMIGKALDATTLASLLDAISQAIIDENLTEEQLKRISQKTAVALEKSRDDAARLALEKIG